MMKQLFRIRYADFLSELRQGRYYGIFVDDTGSPGLTHSSHLHPERKSWVAVVIPPNSSKEVLEQMPGAIEELRISTGAKEFHFADIYAGRKDFEGVDLQLRLALFRFMAHMFAVYKFPVIVQTIDPINVADIHKRASLPKRIGPFNFTKPTDLSLFFLLVRVKWFLQEGNASERALARVFVDEGFQKNGAAIKIPTFKDCFADELVWRLGGADYEDVEGPPRGRTSELTIVRQMSRRRNAHQIFRSHSPGSAICEPPANSASVQNTHLEHFRPEPSLGQP